MKSTFPNLTHPFAIHYFNSAVSQVNTQALQPSYIPHISLYDTTSNSVTPSDKFLQFSVGDILNYEYPSDLKSTGNERIIFLLFAALLAEDLQPAISGDTNYYMQLANS